MKRDLTPHQTVNYPSVIDASDSLFERCSWIYAFCREHLFRDDTNTIALALWNDGLPPQGCHMLEVGCGPGFYACQLAAQFAHLRVTGIDAAAQQVRRARRRATQRALQNCRFEQADVCKLPQPLGSLDAVVAARLFTILPEPERALAEMHRVLRPGGAASLPNRARRCARCRRWRPCGSSPHLQPTGTRSLCATVSRAG